VRKLGEIHHFFIMPAKESKSVKQEVRNKVVTYITTAIGLIAGLAWNDAIKELIENLFPVSKNTILAKIFYALIITILLAVVSVYLARLSSKERK
jgi:hypothetical protein